MKKPYVQFSKRCVVAVLVSTFLLTAVALVGMILSEDYSAVGDLMKYYLTFAGIVFISYCGNSAVEKVAQKIAERYVETDGGNG